MSTVVGVDVGGTSTRIRLARDGTDTTTSAPTAATGGQPLVDRIHQMVLDAAGDSDGIAAVGIGVPGQIDRADGTVRHAVNLGIGDEAYPLGPRLAERLGAPVVVENDVRVGALGALRYVRVRHPDAQDLVYVSIGTGIAAGIVIAGALHRGRHGLAGEIGHVPLLAGGPRCRCGLEGCFEVVAAGPAIVGLWPNGATALFRAAGEGDSAATHLARRVAGHIAHGLHALAAAYDPDVVALGGGVGSSGPDFARFVAEAVASLCERSSFACEVLSPDRLVPIPADVDVGTLGAVALARSVFEQHRSGSSEQNTTEGKQP